MLRPLRHWSGSRTAEWREDHDLLKLWEDVCASALINIPTEDLYLLTVSGSGVPYGLRSVHGAVWCISKLRPRTPKIMSVLLST